MRPIMIFALATLVTFSSRLVQAVDNELTPQEKAEGWQLLFNGKDLTGWRCNNGKPIKTRVEAGSLVPYKSGGYIIIYDKQFSDFILQCDVKMAPECNSGVFFRVGEPKDPVQTGFEVQVATDIGTGRHDFGAIYDLVGPKEFTKPLSTEWNAIRITCKGPNISVDVNGQTVAAMDCDRWTEPHRNPDGTRNKFSTAVKDFPRKGYVGLQDHGHPVWYKNVKLLDLTAK